MIKLVLTDMDDTLIPAGHDGASDYAIAPSASRPVRFATAR